jgi:hypothetical protein
MLAMIMFVLVGCVCEFYQWGDLDLLGGQGRVHVFRLSELEQIQ